MHTSIIDLTHTIHPDIPIWPGDPQVLVTRTASIDQDGYFLQALEIGEHTGTHAGTAAHFREGGITSDQLPAERLIVPSIVIDVREKCSNDPDSVLSIADVNLHEQRYGTIPSGSAVLMNTGWDRHWDDSRAYSGKSTATSGMHFPGFGIEAARFLGDQRGVTALGIDTLGIDRGADTTFRVNSYWLQGARYHLENLTNLDRLPAVGAMLFVGMLKIRSGSGGPARVLAMVPTV